MYGFILIYIQIFYLMSLQCNYALSFQLYYKPYKSSDRSFFSSYPHCLYIVVPYVDTENTFHNYLLMRSVME